MPQKPGCDKSTVRSVASVESSEGDPDQTSLGGATLNRSIDGQGGLATRVGKTSGLWNHYILHNEYHGRQSAAGHLNTDTTQTSPSTTMHQIQVVLVGQVQQHGGDGQHQSVQWLIGKATRAGRISGQWNHYVLHIEYHGCPSTGVELLQLHSYPTKRAPPCCRHRFYKNHKNQINHQEYI